MAEEIDDGQELAELRALRVGQDYGAMSGVREVTRIVTVRKPNKMEWVRARPPEDDSGPWVILTPESADSRPEPYLVNPRVAQVVGDVGRCCELVRGVTSLGVEFVWPVPAGGPGTQLGWTVTHRQAAQSAITTWTRMTASMSLGQYQVFQSVADLGQPEWSPRPLIELIGMAFAGRIIRDDQHPVIQSLLGRSH
jgi:hypothetical protein